MEVIKAGGQSLESSRLRVLEDSIRKNMANIAHNSRQIGEAFREIQNSAMYTEVGYSTMVDYAVDGWGLTKSRIYQLIDYADICDDLEEQHAPWIPANERQARPLKRLDSKDRVKASVYIANEHVHPITERKVELESKRVAPWRAGMTSKPEVMERRAEQRLRKRVEKATIALSAEDDPIDYLMRFGPPAGAQKAWAYLDTMAKREGWRR